MNSCVDCDSHNIISDPDPNDWFCDDDVAVVCTLVENPNRKTTSKYLSDTNPYRCITRSCRPYNTEKETEIPDWCPKGVKK